MHNRVQCIVKQTKIGKRVQTIKPKIIIFILAFFPTVESVLRHQRTPAVSNCGASYRADPETRRLTPMCLREDISLTR